LNVIAADTIFAGGRPAGAAPLLDFAMVHAAIHDAVQAYEKRFKHYAVRIGDATGSPVAAAARAARDVLVNRFPLQTATIHGKYLAFLTNHGVTEADEGRVVGEHAAAGIIARRAGDGSYPTPPPPPDLGGTGAGQWRPTPPALAAFSAPSQSCSIASATNRAPASFAQTRERSSSPFSKTWTSQPALALEPSRSSDSIAKQLVEAHGSSISVESQGLGCGATFTVTLPVAKPVIGELAKKVETEKPEQSSRATSSAA
jgi:hypothetical protein